MGQESIQKIVNIRPDSCAISINAKGLWSAEIKIYAETIEEAIEKALLKAKEMETIIKEKNVNGG